MKVRQFHLFVLKRLAYMIVTVFTVATLVFGATYVLPGNAAVMILGRGASEDSIAALETQLGLNQPLHVQYVEWLSGILAGDFGESLSLGDPVLNIVVDRAVVSLQLAIFALLLTVLVGIPLAVLSATRRDTAFDRVVSSLSYVGVSFPEFVTGSLLVLLFAGQIFDVFPSYQYVPLGQSPSEWLLHLILPVVTLTILLVAHVLRQTRSELIEVLQSEYVRTARLKGLSERTVLLKHALPNGLLPTITILAIDFGYLMGGLVVVESVFALPGLGRLVVFAIQQRDIPLLQMAVLVIAVSYSIANLLADVSYNYLDPRIDYGGRSE
jgi:peptide/nickel transport system permease protein